MGSASGLPAARPHVRVHQRGGRLPGEHAQNPVPRRVCHARHRLFGGGGDMRRQHHIGQAEQRIVQ